MTVPIVGPIYSRGNPDMTGGAIGSGTLSGMARELLARAEHCLVQQGLPVPARRLVYTSPVTADCEQLSVVFTGWLPMPLTAGLLHCTDYRWVGTFAVGITRPAASQTGRTAPTVAAMETTADTASADAEALLLLVNSLDEIADPMIITGSPEGGLQTTTLTVMIPAFGGM
jgi:hypothetical protein